ncbi:MAG: hypothetical protein JNG86_11565, partial [Verrucomicrobiaceae bacterium]|nr:hypothetical protein [Verrucomicrobiaceae bacterium]
MFRAICLSTALLAALPATAAIWVDDFSGTTLNDTNFNTPSGSGNIQFQANGAQSRVELVSTGALVGANHFQQWQHQQTIAYNSAWYFGADVFSGDAALFGAFGSGDIIDLSLNVISSLDSTDRAQFNFVVGSPFGSAIHGARFAKRTNDTDLDEVINGALGAAPVTGRISLQFDPNTSIISAFYNFGSGSTLLGTTNISDWGMTSGHFTFMIEGGASNVSPPNQITGGISIPAASTYLDAAILATPEP